MPTDCKARMPNRIWSCLVAVVITVVLPAFSMSSEVRGAQATKPNETFDVVSIRISQSATKGRHGIRPEPAGLNATDATALDLIKFAFEVIDRDVVGELPSWTTATRFDVVARTANGPLTLRRARAMTRGLLEDRFRLNASSERVDGRVYALVKVRPASATAPFFLRPSEWTCQGDTPLNDGTEQRVPVRNLDLSGRCGLSTVTTGDAVSALFGTRVTMQEFAAHLSRVGGFDLPVIDRTGLNGEFDVAVAPQPDMVAPTSQARFLIALREQAGLTLRAEQGAFDVLRIRHIEQPSPN